LKTVLEETYDGAMKVTGTKEGDEETHRDVTSNASTKIKKGIEMDHKTSNWLEHNNCGGDNVLAHTHEKLRLKAQD
jgi:hypothetical protein